MKQSLSLIAMSLLAGSLTIPSERVYADENPPGNHKQREELRRDQQQLEQLRQQRDRERREGDKHEAREYNERYATRREKFVKTERLSTGKTVTEGMTGIMIMIMTYF